MASQTEARKISHIKVTRRKQVEAGVGTGLDNVDLVHTSLPDLDRENIDLTTTLFGHKLSAPIILESMTGGAHLASKINACLAEAAEELSLAMGVGSQRAAIENPDLEYTYRIAREKAPSIPLFANLGCPQLVSSYGLEQVQRAINMIEADALIVHLNALQESVQFEGDTTFAGGLDKISKIAKEVKIPVILKETGAGFSSEVAIAAEKAGIAGIDIAGLGGTSWAAVEYYRAREKKDIMRKTLGKTFWDWGIPTAISIVEVARSTRLTVIGSGGLRNGFHIAKCVALGASACGLALPLIKAVAKGKEAVKEKLKLLMEEIKTAMFLTASANINDLKNAPVVITGKPREWLELRGFDPVGYARRRRS